MSSKSEAVVLAQSECTSLTNFMMVVYTSMIVLASVIGIYGGCIQFNRSTNGAYNQCLIYTVSTQSTMCHNYSGRGFPYNAGVNDGYLFLSKRPLSAQRVALLTLQLQFLTCCD